MLESGSGIQERCRQIAVLRHELSSEEAADRNLMFIVGIDSELDEFPFGPVRELWAPVALIETDRLRDEYLDRVREPLLAACRALAAWT